MRFLLRLYMRFKTKKVSGAISKQQRAQLDKQLLCYFQVLRGRSTDFPTNWLTVLAIKEPVRVQILSYINRLGHHRTALLYLTINSTLTDDLVRLWLQEVDGT